MHFGRLPVVTIHVRQRSREASLRYRYSFAEGVCHGVLRFRLQAKFGLCTQQGSESRKDITPAVGIESTTDIERSVEGITSTMRAMKSEKMVEGRKMQKLTCASRGLPPRTKTGSEITCVLNFARTQIIDYYHR